MAKIEVLITKVIAKDQKSNFHFLEVTGADLESKGIITENTGKDRVVVKGNVFSPKAGDTIICDGDWQVHPKYGKQLAARQIFPARLIKQNHALSFLLSNFFRGIGKEQAHKIYRQFGDDVFDILEKNPKKIRDFLGEEMHVSFVRDWLRARTSKDGFYFLKSLDVSTEISTKIVEQLSDKAINTISNYPYLLIGLNGIGFKIADSIALKIGIDEKNEERIHHGISFALKGISDNGSTRTYMSEFMDKLFKMTAIEPSIVSTAVNKSIMDGTMSIMNDSYGHSIVLSYELFQKEMDCAEELKRILQSPLDTPPGKIRTIDSKLNEQQRNSVFSSVFNKVSIVTGGPGVGKTKTTKSIIEAIEESCSSESHRNRVVLCAPTGKAARRMSKSTGRDAGTIHTLLEFNQEQGFVRNENNKLELDTLIIDEFSMVDIHVFHAILKALPSSARLVLIGDADQLPSVDPGNVLQDLIDSGCIQSVKLTKTYRQKEGSHIISNAHLINEGKMPLIDSKSEDFHWIDADSDEEIASIVSRLMHEVIPKRFNIEIDEIQVLSPQKGTFAGVDHLNGLLKDKINPALKETFSFYSCGNTFSVNDRVMQIKNNKTLGISNGEVGKIKFIDRSSRQAYVVFDGVEKPIPFDSFKDMRLGYACTIHKSQGSEFDAVIIPVSKNHERMLTPDIVYTGTTRGKQQVFFVGDRDTLKRGLANKYRKKRQTSLCECIRSLIKTGINLQAKNDLDVQNQQPRQKPVPEVQVPF